VKEEKTVFNKTNTWWAFLFVIIAIVVMAGYLTDAFPIN